MQKSKFYSGISFPFFVIGPNTKQLKEGMTITNFKIIYMFKYKEQIFYCSICTSLQ